MEQSINEMRSSLDQKERELNQLRLIALRPGNASNASTVAEVCSQLKSAHKVATTAPKIDAPLALKNLETAADNDRRSYSDKLNEFLSTDAPPDKAAIASRMIFDLAQDRNGLPDYTLQSVYNTQSDPELRRVIAQVLSQRGNHALLDSQITDLQSKLKSQEASDRQSALIQLARLRSARAADVVAPYLHDPDITVRLEALTALRDTGNQQHLGLVEGMVNDPNPSISMLAADGVATLRNLSSKARTTLTKADIEANLPPLPAGQ